MSPTDDRKPPRLVNADDVDDVIGVALELKQRSEEQLSEAELAAVGSELGLSAEQIGNAITELTSRRQRDTVRGVEAQRRRRRRLIGTVIAAGVVLVVALGSQASLRARLGAAEQKRAQLANVQDTRQETRQRYQGQPLTAEREAELAGADNRVRVERMRYDEAAADYNRRATGIPGRWWVALSGLPARLPLSDEGGSR